MSEFLDKYAADAGLWSTIKKGTLNLFGAEYTPSKNSGFLNDTRKGLVGSLGAAYGAYSDDITAAQGARLAVDLSTDRNGTTDIINRAKLGYDAYNNGGSIDSLQTRLTSVANNNIKFLFRFMDPSEVKKMTMDEISRGVALVNGVGNKGNHIGELLSKDGISQISKFVDEAEKYAIQRLALIKGGHTVKFNPKNTVTKEVVTKVSDPEVNSKPAGFLRDWLPSNLDVSTWTGKQWAGGATALAGVAATGYGLYKYFSDDEDEREDSSKTKSKAKSRSKAKPKSKAVDRNHKEWSDVYKGVDY